MRPAVQGTNANPASWSHNVVGHPESLTVEIGRKAMTAKAEVLPAPLRAELDAVPASRYPGFAAYQAKTERLIPVIALDLHGGE